MFISEDSKRETWPVSVPSNWMDLTAHRVNIMSRTSTTCTKKFVPDYNLINYVFSRSGKSAYTYVV